MDVYQSEISRGLRNWCVLILAILLVIGLLPNAAYAAGSDVTVENFSQLKTALQDQDVNTITVTAPISFTEMLAINRSISFVSDKDMIFALDESFSGRHFSIVSTAGPVTVDFGTITLDGGSRGGGVYVSIYNPVTLKGGTIQSCSNSEGGAIYATSGDRRETTLLTLEMDKIINNTASSKGGAVYITSSSPNAINAVLAISGGEMSGNSSYQGGAVYSFFGKEVAVSGGVLDNNSAKGTGGAFFLAGGKFSITDGMICNNTSGGDAGAVYVASANSNPSFVEIAGGTFDSNRAIKAGWNTRGGAIYMNDDFASFSMTGGVFSNNTAAQGGAIANADNPKPSCTFTITGGTFNGNIATSVPGGGALIIKKTPVEISNARFIENEATKIGSAGGAVYCTGNATIKDGVFTDNSAYSGGAVAAGSKLALSGGRLASNTAQQDGGAISVSNFADITTDGVSFMDNKGFFAFPTLPDGTITDTHVSNITNGTTYTNPFTHAFNNYDIAPASRSADDIAMGSKHFCVEVKAGANGSLGAPDGVQPFRQANSDLTEAELAQANPVADPGYAFDGWEMADGTQAVFPIQIKKDVHLTATFTSIPTVTLTFETNGGSLVAPVSTAEGSKITLDQTTARDGYEFTGWYGDPGLTTRLSEIELDTNKTVYAGWRTVSSGGSSGSGVERYTITFETNGGSPVSKIEKAKGTKITFDQTTSRDGYVFTGWYADQALSDHITEATLTKNMTVYAGWRDAGILNINPKLGYMIGYDDGQFGPDAPISRAEVSTIFYRLLSNQIAEGSFSFADIHGDEWYAEPILVLASKGILIGDSGVFRPNDGVTRAEFATILSRLIPEQPTKDGTAFRDVSTYHWALEDIERVAAFGIINGYPDGMFRPDNKITRAEAVTMINRLLGRTPDKQLIEMGIGVTDFPDVPKTYWAYYEIQAAVNGIQSV